MEALQRLRQQVVALWWQLGRRQRILVVGAAAGAVFIVVAMSALSSRTVLEPLYTDLEPDDAAVIVDRLREQGVSFEITEGGHTILVQADRVLDLRLTMASEGLPTGGSVGFGIFDETSFTITDLTQRVNFQRALQGELERTIKSLRSVETARVLLVIPRQSLFLESQQPATASVAVSLRAGREIPAQQVQGIRHLVAAAVEGLEPAKVTIVDGNGTVLDSDLASGDLSAGATQLEIQRAFEREQAQAIQRVVERVIGPNRSAVTVAVSFDWSSTETTREVFEPVADGNPLARSRQSITETYSGPGVTPPGGVPGVTTNTPPTGEEGSTETSGTSTYARSEVTENNELTKSVERNMIGPGRLLSMRVSVLLDASVAEADVAAIQDAVGNMIDESRGDSIVVSTATFNTEAQEEAQAALAEAAQAEQMANLITMGVVGVVVLAVLVFLWRTLRAIRRGAASAALRTPELPAGVSPKALGVSPRALETAYGPAAVQRDTAAGLRARFLDEDEGEEEADKRLDSAQAAQQKRARNQRQLAEFARQQPESMVRLLETWMAED